MQDSEETKQEITDLSVEIADAALQLVTESEIFDAIPILSTVCTVYKAGKAALSIPNILFLRKVERVIRTVHDKTTQDEREKFAAQLKADKKRMDDLYEVILLKIDKLDDTTKPEIFAKILASYISGRIAKPEFDALSHALDSSSLRELNAFSAAVIVSLISHGSIRTEAFKNLISSGLMSFDLKQALDYRASGFLPAAVPKTYLSSTGDQPPPYQIGYSVTELGKLYAFISEDLEPYIQMTITDSSAGTETIYDFIFDASFEEDVKDKYQLDR